MTCLCTQHSKGYSQITNIYSLLFLGKGILRCGGRRERAIAGETAAAQNPNGIIYAALFYGTLGLAIAMAVILGE